jgi:hypothetical protein
MFGVLRCEKDSAAQDSPQIVKTLAGDTALSQRRCVCESAEFKSRRTSSDVARQRVDSLTTGSEQINDFTKLLGV